MNQADILIEGGKKLCGEIPVQGAKNSVLPIMAATLLAEGVFILHHCPRISDVKQMISIMEELGCRISWQGESLLIDTRGPISGQIPDGKASEFRGSSLLMGALLGRNGAVRMEKPGGCCIGARPLDFHFEGFRKLGVRVEAGGKDYICECRRLKGSRIPLPFPSVGATENLMLAAARAEGMTEISGCAKEPEITDLADFLIHMGVPVCGAGTSCIRICGKPELVCAEFTIPYDRIAAATYLFGAAVTKGEIKLHLNGGTWRMENILKLLERMGGRLFREKSAVALRMNRSVRGICMETGPYPGIPTDIQSMVLASVLTAEHLSVIIEKVFESRFQVSEELGKMGGRIRIESNKAVVTPVKKLTGTAVRASDLRGGAALILGGLQAEGITAVESCFHIGRGYEDIVRDFQMLGANIRYSGDMQVII